MKADTNILTRSLVPRHKYPQINNSVHKVLTVYWGTTTGCLSHPPKHGPKAHGTLSQENLMAPPGVGLRPHLGPDTAPPRISYQGDKGVCAHTLPWGITDRPGHPCPVRPSLSSNLQLSSSRQRKAFLSPNRNPGSVLGTDMSPTPTVPLHITSESSSSHFPTLSSLVCRYRGRQWQQVSCKPCGWGKCPSKSLQLTAAGGRGQRGHSARQIHLKQKGT